MKRINYIEFNITFALDNLNQYFRLIIMDDMKECI